MAVIRQIAPRSTTHCPEHYTDGRPAAQAPPLRLPVEKGGRQGGAHVPKAQRFKRRGRGPRPYNTESARRV